jgi:hypothetical protein
VSLAYQVGDVVVVNDAYVWDLDGVRGRTGTIFDAHPDESTYPYAVEFSDGQEPLCSVFRERELTRVFS